MEYICEEGWNRWLKWLDEWILLSLRKENVGVILYKQESQGGLRIFFVFLIYLYFPILLTTACHWLLWKCRPLEPPACGTAEVFVERGSMSDICYRKADAEFTEGWTTTGHTAYHSFCLSEPSIFLTCQCLSHWPGWIFQIRSFSNHLFPNECFCHTCWFIIGPCHHMSYLSSLPYRHHEGRAPTILTPKSLSLLGVFFF